MTRYFDDNEIKEMWKQIDELRNPEGVVHPPKDPFKCGRCKNDLTLNEAEGTHLCTECGYCTFTVFSSFSDTFQGKSATGHFTKRSVHSRRGKMRAKLREIQGINIPPEHVLHALKPYAIETIYDVRRALKREHLSRYNSKCHSILKHLTQKRLFTISSFTCDKLMADFSRVEIAFKITHQRRNIFGYNYMLGKILEHNGIDSCDKIFDLKGNSTRKKNDAMWDEMGVW